MQIKPFSEAKSIIEQYNTAVKTATLSNKKFDDIIAKSDDTLTSHLKTVRGTETNYKAYTSSLNGAKATTIGMTIAQGALKVATMAANAALTMGISLLVTGAIEGVAYLREKFLPTADEMIEKANALRSEFESSTSTISNQLKSLKSLEPEYIKLSKGVSEYGENISLTSDEYERYKEIIAEILGYTPELTTGYDNEGKAIASKNGLLEKSKLERGYLLWKQHYKR